MRCLTIIFLLVASAVPAVPAAETRPDVAADEKILTDANLKHDGRSLLEFLRRRTARDEDLGKMARLIPKLGDEKFAVRRTALNELKELKPPEALAGQLRRLGFEHPDAEVQDQCRMLVRQIEKTSPTRLAGAVARLLRDRKPDGAAGVLLAYLPSAQNEVVEEEILTTLILLGIKDGKVDAALGPVLKDKIAARRGAAAMLLGRSGAAEEKKAVTTLLGDKDSVVRLRAAQGLIAGRDKEAVPVLIALLDEGSLQQATHAEDLLAVISAGRGPRMPLGETDGSRKKCREAWAAWWKTSAGKFDLAKAEADLSPFNPSLRLRETIRQYLVAMNRGDAATVVHLTEVPFQVLGQQILNTREDAKNYWSNMAISLHQQNFTFGAGMLVSLDDYLRTAPAHEKEPLSRLKKSEIRVLYINTYLNGQFAPNNARWRAVLFRIDGVRVQAFAVGQGMQPVSR